MLTHAQVDFLGKHGVDNTRAQDHGCTDEAIALLWEDKKGEITMATPCLCRMLISSEKVLYGSHLVMKSDVGSQIDNSCHKK